MEYKELSAALEAILFASGDPVPAERIAQVLGADVQQVFAAADVLANDLAAQGRGVRLLRLEGDLQLVSAPDYAQVITQALEQRRPPRLSPAALEVLAIVAYFQPVTRAYIDQIRGVDSSYTVGVLCERGLIEAAGKLEVPGRPTLYRTGDVFLRTMGVSSLAELPALPEVSGGEGMDKLQAAIDRLSRPESPPAEQISINDLNEITSEE